MSLRSILATPLALLHSPLRKREGAQQCSPAGHHVQGGSRIPTLVSVLGALEADAEPWSTLCEAPQPVLNACEKEKS